ncbi:tetratricopeptide repeat protein [Pseudanabaena sp. ABRG5-3]|uniref:tetratricopeptide repeat protein n=1 Tax=Pseudanabaena sp. ABRG5-3 TaxID=685565 RepID=UPI000DC730E1|nr:tetratricopeptide repeat protein [Pseudanabaena sp. ABRG5-3]BBC26260.1 tetratricopeptide TPR_1 repeat-containing protein [Pseudanabaena sp. ABRG5-3]
MKINKKYVERNDKDVNKFISAFKDSLEESISTGKKVPFIFLLYGLGGVGKHDFLDNLEEVAKKSTKKEGKNSTDVRIIRINFGQLGTPKEALKLMDKIASDPAFDKNLVDNILHSLQHENHLFQGSTFREVSNLYQDTLHKLGATGSKSSEPVTKEQIESVSKLAELGGKVITSSLALALGAPALLMPMASSIGGEIVQIVRTSPEIAASLLEIKDGLLNQHHATQNENVRKLLLAPLIYLTPLFIEMLIEASKKQSIILIFEKYEKIHSTDKLTSDLNEWFCQFLFSTESKLFNHQPNHKVIIIISGRNQLTKQDNWSNFIDQEQDSQIAIELCLDCFKEKEEVDNYCKQQLEKELTDEERDEVTQKYFSLTKGHPKYLELLCKQRKEKKEIDDSVINRDILNVFLSGFSDEKQKIIQIISCCRWFDQQLIQYFLDQAILELNTSQENQKTDVDYLFDWLSKQYFVILNQDRYHFHDLVRQVLRRNLFQENRELFYEIHNHLAIYFKQRADKLNPDKLPFTKYSDIEWCGYIGEYLYHACFAQKSDYQSSFLYHLFASIYLRKNEIIQIAFDKICEESSGTNNHELKDHPLLQSPTKIFLKTLEFVAKYKWVAFELNYNTHYGKYRSRIEAVVQLAKNHFEQLNDDIGKVAVLEYIVKNFSQNASKEDKYKWEAYLRDAIDKTANHVDPTFSSQLFMQSVCWQSDHDDISLNWCKKALEYKPDNANALFKQGHILKLQGDKYKDQKNEEEARDHYEEALKNYEKAISIQRYDHRFWEAKGQTLECLRQNIEISIEKNKNHHNHDENQAESLRVLLIRKVEYCQKEVDSYYQTMRFRPTEKDNYYKSLKKYKDALKDFMGSINNQSMEALDIFIKSINFDKHENSLDNKSYGGLVDSGDKLRLLTCSSDEDKEEKLQEAIDKYNLAITMNPEFPLAWYSRGLAYAERAKLHQNKEELFRLAIKDYDKALNLRDDLTWALYDKGIALHYIADKQSDQLGSGEAKSEYKDALENFDRAIQIDPEYEDAWYRRGLTLTKLERYEEAIANFDKAIEITTLKNPKNADKLWYDRGIAYRNYKAYEEAISSFKKAIDIRKDYSLNSSDSDPNVFYYDAEYNLGWTLKENQEYEKAIEVYDKITETITDKAQVYFDLGQIYAIRHKDDKEKNKEKAIQQYNKCLEYAKDDLKYKCQLALVDLLLNQRNYTSAIQFLENALDFLKSSLKNKEDKYIEMYLPKLQAMSQCFLESSCFDNNGNIWRLKSIIKSCKNILEPNSIFLQTFENESVFQQINNKKGEDRRTKYKRDASIW